ncbi:MAG: nucleotide exchange factor GrpE [Candidatus Atribacteria bacterium]|nr:nucleotide exchange factor GrpE [Candidatus Atribacteria bacterium]
MNKGKQHVGEDDSVDKVILEDLNKMKKPELISKVIVLDKQLLEALNSFKKTEIELEKMKENEKTGKEQLIRMQADFENYKKREELKKREFMEYAKKDLICQLLSVMDNLERASCYTDEQADEKHLNDIKKGLDGILKDFQSILEKEGLKPIKSVGEKFDPYYHEAIMHVESDKFPEDTVMEEIVKGYYLKSKVLRPSVVKVSKGCIKKPEKSRKKPEDME